MRRAVYLLLFAGSGAAALVYQVAWMRELGLLFGNTTHAAASVLAVFFLGLAIGGAWWGRRAPALSRPLVAFGLLELGVAGAALVAMALIPLYHAVFGPLYAALGDHPFVLGIAKLLLSAACLLPAAILMGGTLPVIGQALLVDRERLGRGGGWLYGVNTLGAAGGAFAAAFLLPQALGYRLTYAVALATSVSIGLVALGLARGAPRALAAEPVADRRPLPVGVVALAFASGFLALALEVLWTRAFALVLQNSVYTFGAIVVVYLLSLGLGALAAAVLARTSLAPRRVLVGVLLLASALVVFAPRAFGHLHPLAGLDGSADFGAYIGAVFRFVSLVVLPSTVVLGIVLPYLLRHTRSGAGSERDAGFVLGRLVAWNTVGALLGALVAGFGLAAWVGPWIGIAVIGGGYLVAAALVVRTQRPAIGAALVLLLLPIGFEAHVQHEASRERMVPYRVDPASGARIPTEDLVAVYEGAAGTVTVTRTRSTRTTKLRYNRHYTLGASSDPRWERLQAHLPLLLHPDPRSVFFVGMGTGVTAGAALVHPVERVVVAEIVPEVVRAAEDHFADLANGLFTDERVTILRADARAVLRGSDQRHDVIIGDLFLPWKRGVGSLFTEDQLRAGRDRLTEHGIYAQWLPLYQIGRRSFDSIARTFLEVFPRVTLWRDDMFADRPIVAVIGHASEDPIDAAAYQARFRAFADRGLIGFEQGADVMAFHLYAGDLGALRADLADAPVNTDDRPWLELQAPVDQRGRAAGRESALTGTRLLALYARLHELSPPANDLTFAGLTFRQVRWIEGGRFLFAYAVAEAERDTVARGDAWREWFRRTLGAERPAVDDWIR